jgi:hypothetical protein
MTSTLCLGGHRSCPEEVVSTALKASLAYGFAEADDFWEEMRSHTPVWNRKHISGPVEMRGIVYCLLCKSTGSMDTKCRPISLARV